MATTDTPGGARGLFAGAAGAWTLDPATSSIKLQTKAMWGLAKVKGGFTLVGGGGTVTEDGAVSGVLTIDATSINTGNTKRDTHLRSADFLESETHPTITYTATSASPAGDDRVKVSGTLTVHGETRPLDVMATVVQTGPQSATLTADVDIDRSAWGLSWAKMGARLTNQLLIVASFTKS